MTATATDEYENWMRRALELARQAEVIGEVPVGAVLVRDGEVLGEGFNQPIVLNDPSAHAEMLALRSAAGRVGNYRLPGTTLYVTVEPCTMCAGAAVNARIDKVVFGAPDLEAGALGSVYHLGADPRLRHTFDVHHNVLGSECTAHLKSFFAALRSGE